MTAELWFLTGSQSLYGQETLDQVAEQSQDIAARLDAKPDVPVTVVWKPVLLDAEAIHRRMLEANSAPECVGVIAWMHTFSPAKMWIAGLERPDQAAAAPAHPGRDGAPLEHHRHGLHEPQPGGARRP